MFPVVVKRLAAPQAGDDVESFVEQFGARLAIGHLAKFDEAGIDRAQADGEDHTSVR